MFDEHFFFIQAKTIKCSENGVKIPFLESTYPEMQRKHIPRVNKYQSSTSSHPVDDIKHQSDTVPVDA